MNSRAMPWLAVCGLTSGCVIENWFDDPDDSVDDAQWVEERFTQQALPKVDVLFIVDNTGSMAEEHAFLAEGFTDFVSALDAASLSYQLGVIHTDMSGSEAGVLQGNPWIVSSSLDDPETAFAQAVDVGTDGASPEAGLAAMVTALREPLRSGANRGFRRSDAALQVVVVSDDDDGSEAWLGADPVGVAAALLVDEAASGLSAVFSAVVGEHPAGCVGAYGTAFAGESYLELVELTGGVAASICEADLAAVYESLGSQSVQYGTRFELQTAPLVDSLRVSVEGVRTEAWQYDPEGWAVVFDEPPPPNAFLEIRYQLEEEG